MTFYEQAKKLVSKMTITEKLSQMRYDAPAIERLGIPAYNWWNECLHGVARNGVATVFPQAIGLAASFNKERMFEVASATSDEIRAKYNENKKQGFTDIYQGLTMCSPNINIFRDPRWGRGHETYGEDTTLTGMMAVEFVKGLQGDGKYRKADATLKHYAVHSGPEKDRHSFNVNIDDETMFETYLKAFEYCIKNAKPAAVMCAYNSVNGEPCTASHTMIKDILRGKLGFEGYVESDAGAVEYIALCHKLTYSIAAAAAMAVNNGCDLCLGVAYESLKEAYDNGWISEETVTESVTRLFETRYRLGMFADDCEYDKIPYEVVDCKKHKDLNLKMAHESMVLLKNDGILPLDPNKKIAVIGPNADELSVLLGNYNGTPSEYTTLLKGIQNSYENVIYAKGCDHWKQAQGHLERRNYEAVIAAQRSDVVIMCMGLTPFMEGEAGDAYNAAASGDKLSIELPEVQKELFEKIIALGKPVIFVNVTGSCVALGEQDKKCNAVIQCFYPGARGGEALADILFGKCSPSGRLPVTFYASDDDLPDFTDYSMENRTYKYFKGTPVYEFGHGLTYSEITENWTDENTAQITNSGKFDTYYSVLQFEYIPHKSLKNFKKIFIKQGETQTVKF